MLKKSEQEKFLSFLEVEKTSPSLDLLNELIKQHHLKVKWENVTKIIDSVRQKDYLPPLDLYIDRITILGAGGTCWTLNIGFYQLLKSLGFDVHYLYMDSGHLCLRVNLDKPYYVDVGFDAPLFKAYPLFETFHTKDEREIFTYIVNEKGIQTIREPGPTKTLNANPVTLKQIQPLIEKANNWKTAAPLQKIFVNGYVDGIKMTLTNQTLKQYFPGEKIELQLSEEEVKDWINDKFKMDLDLYLEAKEIFHLKHGNE